jgi:hypothetical protein
LARFSFPALLRSQVGLFEYLVFFQLLAAVMST